MSSSSTQVTNIPSFGLVNFPLTTTFCLSRLSFSVIGRLGLSFEQMKSQERAAALAAEAQMKSGGGGKK